MNFTSANAANTVKLTVIDVQLAQSHLAAMKEGSAKLSDFQPAQQWPATQQSI